MNQHQPEHGRPHARHRRLPRACALLLVCAAAGPGHPARAAGPDAKPGQPDPAAVAQAIQDWPKPARDAAQEMLRKYGPPAEVAPTRLLWQDNGRWLRTVVHKSPVEHDFPVKHADVLEQVIEYRVPLNFYAPLAVFNGSVVPYRTRGELASTGAGEADNVLSLNLADDIIQGRKNADQARDAMEAAAREMQAGRVPEEAQNLRVIRQQGDTRDPDTAVVAAPPSPARSPAR